MKRFWVSWWQPGENFGPVTFPPNRTILGFWSSGFRPGAKGREYSVCALVDARSEEHVKEMVALDWPESEEGEWRFIQEVNNDFQPEYPLDEWMKERITLA